MAKSEPRPLRPAALLVLLAAAAGAGIVASNFLATNDLLHRPLVTAACHARLLQFAALAALEGFFHIVHRGRWPVPSRTRAEGRHSIAVPAGRRKRRLRSRSRRLEDLHQIEVAYRLFLEALHHGFEHVKGFALVLHQRIVLPVPAQPDTFAQVVHAEQVVLPLLVDDAQHDDALVMAHRVRANQALLGVVALFELLEDRVTEFLPVELLRVNTLGRDVHTEAGEQLVLQALDVPILGMSFLSAVLVEQAAEKFAHIVFEDEFLLVNTFQQLPAQSVHRLPLLVHYVVVFEQVFAGLEVLPLDRLLRRFNTPRDETRFNRNALFHPQPLEQV